MKSIIAAILFCFATTSFAASYDMKTGDDLVGDRCAPGDVIYYGVTKKGTKDVVICQDGQTVTYGFGNILKNWSGKDLVLTVDAADVVDDKQLSGEIIMISNKSHTYGIYHIVNIETGKEFNQLKVLDNKNFNKIIAVIDLDNDFIVNNIRDNFVPFAQ